MTTTKTIAAHAHQTCAITKNNMKTIYIQDQDLDATERTAALDRTLTAAALRLRTPLQRDAGALRDPGTSAGLATVRVAPSHRAGEEPGVRSDAGAADASSQKRGRCTPACRGCTSEQMDFARGVAGRAA